MFVNSDVTYIMQPRGLFKFAKRSASGIKEGKLLSYPVLSLISFFLGKPL